MTELWPQEAPMRGMMGNVSKHPVYTLTHHLPSGSGSGSAASERSWIFAMIPWGVSNLTLEDLLWLPLLCYHFQWGHSERGPELGVGVGGQAWGSKKVISLQIVKPPNVCSFLLLRTVEYVGDFGWQSVWVRISMWVSCWVSNGFDKYAVCD